MTGPGLNDVAFTRKIPFTPSECSFLMKGLQFPRKPCLSTTIDKAQGQSLRRQCFSHDYFYVGRSRVRTPDNLFIKFPQIKCKNMLYKCVLQQSN